MVCELKFRKPPLPELCMYVATLSTGAVSQYFQKLSRYLNEQVVTDVCDCSSNVILECSILSPAMCQILELVGGALGRFDIEGQIVEIQRVKSIASNMMQIMREKLQRYGKTNCTLWICAGIALAIILI